MKKVGGICLFFCAAAALAQTTVISNLNQPNGGDYSGVGENYTSAVAFTTGNTNTLLANVSVLLDGSYLGLFPAMNPPGTLNVSLYNDVGGSPGSSLAVLSGNSSPMNAGVYTYASTSAVELSRQTTYWLVLSSNDSTNGAGYGWNESTTANVDSGSVWTLGVSKSSNGSAWQSSPGLEFQFSVSALTTPPAPPAMAIAQPIVLTYTNNGWPYVLQQNSNVATTNWVNVTNAILSGAISNQIVFILPPGAPQRFYRLGSP